MRKRMRLTQHMGDHHDFNSDDFLSRLPDAILVSILSRLPLKDAAVTSQLSRRWRYLWCQTNRLHFEVDKGLDDIAQPKLRLLEMNKYINWVNRVIRQHKSVTIEELKICLDLDKNCKGAITKWIEFAFSKNVQRLELDLLGKSEIRRDYVLNFVFPNKILDGKSGSSSLKRQSYSSIPRMPSTKILEMKFLKVLILKHVNINDEAISKILVSCRVLEHLSIHEAYELVNLKITGPQLALNSLEIYFCPVLESIEICDSNLAYFFFSGRRISLKIDKVPKTFVEFS